MRLREIKSLNLQPWMFNSHEEIVNWLSNYSIKGKVLNNLEIENNVSLVDITTNDSVIESSNGYKLPVQFADVKSFQCLPKLVSLKGLPRTVSASMTLHVEVDSFEDLPVSVSNLLTIYLYSPSHIQDLTHMSDCPKIIISTSHKDNCYVKSIKGLSSNTVSLMLGTDYGDIQDVYKYAPQLDKLLLPNLSKMNVNGLLNILKFKNLSYYSLGDDTKAQLAIDNEVFDIIGKHIKGDIIDCQEELIEAGYKEFAKL
jgi:hypothetical protein